MQPAFLPTTAEEIAACGWDGVDVVLVTGDAYVDHPSFGVALIGRVLVDNGFRVAVLPQPRWRTPEDFLRLPRPRLFCGISGGNLDPVVANYSANGRVRDRDAYCPGGAPWFPGRRERKNRRRPDRAAIVYASLARAAWPGVPLVLGGIEASLRRFIHYDFKQDRLRGSILTDAKADILVYGMGEVQVVEIARRLAAGEGLGGIPGTCERTGGDGIDGAVRLPGWEEIARDSALFMAAELEIERQARGGGRRLFQRQKGGVGVVQHPAPPPLDRAGLDHVYSLPFSRRPHPAAGEVPAWRMVRDSVTIVRGCVGNCSFCAISRHQGNRITSRSPESVLAEVERIAAAADFGGTITDLGGPTANLYGTGCRKGGCARRDCLMPRVCPHLSTGGDAFIDLLRRCRRVRGVKRVLVSSGLRMELLLETPELLREIIRHHTPGRLKIAPEHTEERVLSLMHKPGFGVCERFLAEARRIAREEGTRLRVRSYLISAHPGADEAAARRMAARLAGAGLAAEAVQDFTPTPGTMSTAMYVCGASPRGEKIPVARTAAARARQRAVIQGRGRKGRRSGRP